MLFAILIIKLELLQNHTSGNLKLKHKKGTALNRWYDKETLIQSKNDLIGNTSKFKNKYLKND